MFELNLMWLGVTLFLVPIFAEYGKIKTKAGKGFLWLGAGGAMYLLSAAFQLGITGFAFDAMKYATALFSVIGLVATLIGAILVLLAIFR